LLLFSAKTNSLSIKIQGLEALGRSVRRFPLTGPKIMSMTFRARLGKKDKTGTSQAWTSSQCREKVVSASKRNQNEGARGHDGGLEGVPSKLAPLRTRISWPLRFMPILWSFSLGPFA